MSKGWKLHMELIRGHLCKAYAGKKASYCHFGSGKLKRVGKERGFCGVSGEVVRKSLIGDCSVKVEFFMR